MEKKVDWVADGEGLRRLFATTWKRHPILRKDYFDWHFSEKPGEGTIGYCAVTNDGRTVAGVYSVVRTPVLVDGQSLTFSTSLKTMTHPLFYGKGLFVRLARRTYDECCGAGILGTIGVPNNNSLPGFVNSLGFKSLGKLSVMSRIAPCFRFDNCKGNGFRITEFGSEAELTKVRFRLDQVKAERGVVICERNEAFLSWRFFHCPGVKYRVLAAIDRKDSAIGLLVLRFATKRHLPITVLLDFIIDETSPEAEIVANQLFAKASRLAWQHLSPVMITLVNPHMYETSVLSRLGFRPLPRAMLPHDSNLIIKFHKDLPDKLSHQLSRFENWFFSFADYDIF